MSVRGLRIHLAGSADLNADDGLLTAAHELARTVAQELIEAGAGLVVGVGAEPIGDEGLPCTFDWTVLETLACASDPAPNWPKQHGGRFRVVASQRALEKIPDWRQGTWATCAARSDFELETPPIGWRMGGAIRARQALRGDILVVLGGGAGVEQLAELYLEEGKRVIPIRSDLGAVSRDGRGGGSYLHGWAMQEVAAFFSLRDGTGGATARLSRLRLEASTDASAMAAELVSLLQDLRPPRAFYVRLLATDHDAFKSVERFFRDVVDPVVAEEGFDPHEVGRHKHLSAFLNVEIFEGIHRAGLVVVDLTGLRPNCTMELGYALGRRKRVVLSAKEGASLGFDQDKLPVHFWTEAEPAEGRVRAYRDWFERHIDMPPIVS